MAQRVEAAPQLSRGHQPTGPHQPTEPHQLTQLHPITRTRARPTASVVVTVPAHKDCVVIARSTVAQLAACFGFTVQEVTDLRLAVGEVCGLLVAGASGDASAVGAMECRAEVRGDLLRVEVAAPAGGFDAPDADSLGWTMMSALVDALAWAHDGITARVALDKRRRC